MSWKTIFIFILISGWAAHAVELYQWTDPDGGVHYGDRPPPGQPFRKLRETGPPLIGAPVQPSVSHPPAATERRPAPARRSSRSGAASSAGRTRECDRLQSRIAAIEASMRKGYREPRGNQLRQQRRRLSDRYYSECYR